MVNKRMEYAGQTVMMLANVELLELAYLTSRYCMFLAFIVATIIWIKKGMCFGFVGAALLVGCTTFLYLRYRGTELYRLYHCTNKVFFDKLLSYLQKCKKPVLLHGRSEHGFYILDGYQGLWIIYYLPFQNRGSKCLHKIRRYVEDMDDLTGKYDADYSIMILNDNTERKIRLLQKVHSEYSFEFWKRRTVCRMICNARE